MALQLTKVKLPDRTRARFEAESNQQRVQKPHDIRGAIPLVDYTNPAKFPPYLYREYPKMPLLDNNRPIVIDESGGVLIFYDAADEVDFKGLNPELAEEIERNTPEKALADAIAAKDTEISDLRSRLRAAGLTEDDDKPPNALARAVRPQGPVEPEPTERPLEASGEPAPAKDDDGLRANLPPNPLKKKH